MDWDGGGGLGSWDLRCICNANTHLGSIPGTGTLCLDQAGQKKMFFVANLHEGPDLLSQVWPSEVSLKQSGVMEYHRYFPKGARNFSE